MLNFLKKICSYTKSFFYKIFGCKKNTAKEAIQMHENMTEKQVDKMVKDSFPASDPPSTY